MHLEETKYMDIEELNTYNKSHEYALRKSCVTIYKEYL